jgi:hypothetical protein
MSLLRMLKSLPRMLMSCEMVLLSALFGGTAMSMSRNIMQFGGSLVVFVVGGHYLKRHNLPGLRMGLLSKLVGAIRIFQSALGMPVSRFVVSFFIVLRGSAMGLRCSFMFLSGFSV